MSLRVVIIGLLMLTAAALGLIAYQIANPPRAPGMAAAPQVVIAPITTSYLIAAHAVLPGTLARSDDFSVRTVPSDRLPPGVVIDSPESRASLRGALLKRYLDAGAPLLSEDLIRPKERGFLAAVLAPGSRAVSIGVDPVSGVAGLIWPGDHVDIILTQELDPPDGSRTKLVASESVLANIRVIAVDQDIAQGAPATGNTAGRLASTVTVQVTTDQAERLAVARRLGTLSLAIRAVSDELLSSQVGAPTSGADVSLVRARATNPTATVQVIQGDQRNEVKFR